MCPAKVALAAIKVEPTVAELPGRCNLHRLKSRGENGAAQEHWRRIQRAERVRPEGRPGHPILARRVEQHALNYRLSGTRSVVSTIQTHNDVQAERRLLIVELRKLSAVARRRFATSRVSQRG